MFNKLKTYIFMFTRDEGLSFNARMINMVLIVGFISSALTAVCRSIVGNHPFVIATLLGITATCGLMLYISRRYKLVGPTVWFTIVMLCGIFFPVSFFFIGGLSTSYLAYFILTVTMIFLFLRGISFAITITLHMLSVIACYVMAYLYPDFFPVATRESMLFEAIFTFISVSVILGIVVKVMVNLYNLEQKKIEKSKLLLEREKEITTSIFMANPHMNILFSDKLEPIDFNNAALKFIGYSSRDEFKDKFPQDILKAIPEYQPDGTKSKTMQQRFADAIEFGETLFETVMIFRNQARNMQVIMKRIPYRDSYAITVYGVDMTEIFSIRDSLMHQDTLLEVINHTAKNLLSANSSQLQTTLTQAMRELGNLLDIDTLYVWKNSEIEGDVYFEQQFSWRREEYRASKRVPSKGLISYKDVLPTWGEELAKGNIINGSLESFSRRERKRVAEFGLESAMLIPVFFEDRFWGFLSFADHHKDYTFSTEEVHILHSASLIIVNAIERAAAEDRLNLALDEAIAASQSKTIFLSNMSHEMRTPMNAIIGMSTIGQNASGVEKKDESFGKIKEASNHLLGVINDVLDMSKIEANKLELNRVEFNFLNMLKSIINVVGFKVKESRHNLEFQIDPDVPKILIGDDQRLSQVLTNLLSNAVKFTPQGGNISLEVKMAEKSDEAVTLEISVIDTGIGISDEQRGRLFNSFEQAENSTSRKYGGTGLGLAISKRIIEMMDGRIWVESELGLGSKFSFEVALKLGNQADCTLLDGSDAACETKVAPDLSNNLIMIAEDIDINREIIIALLEPTGVQIEIAENGLEALEMFTANPKKYAMILMDVQMPEMDGFVATRSIRAIDNEWAKKIPIVAMTANVFKEDVEQCLAAGMVDHIGKPIDIDVAMSVIQKYL